MVMDFDIQEILFKLAAFVGGFSLLVFIHEWGHFSVARLFGVKVDTFSIGMGKELFGRTDRNGTRWKVSAFPIGGYVKFFGDATAASSPGDMPTDMSREERDVCFHFKPLWQKALVVFAGPAVNLIAAVLLMAVLIYINGYRVSEPVVSVVAEGTAAEEAGFQVDDRILQIDGTKLDRFSDLARIVSLRPGQQLTFLVERSGEQLMLRPTIGIRYMKDRFDNQYPQGYLGVGPYQKVVADPGVLESLGEGSRQAVSVTKTIFTTLGQMILGIRSVKELGGPVRIADTIGEAAQISFQHFIWIIAMLSLNLGIVNLLPIPVLDGGHLVYYGLEAVKGSPVSKKAQEAGFVAGFALLLIFMVLVTLNDLQSMAL
jgi:regulator of sigma E protease